MFKLKLLYSYYSLLDLSEVAKGEKLLEILSSHGFVVDKVDDVEPIRKNFDASMLPEFWKGVGPTGGHSTCYFLFKGQKEIKFSGMVTWNINLRQNSKTFNGVLLRLTCPKKFDVNNLISLGDELFTWSGSVYGYITEESIYRSLKVSGLYDGLPGLFWVNYFGPAYITEPDFQIPSYRILIGQGVRVCLSEKPSDDKLYDSNFLQDCMNQFGAEWFRIGTQKKRRRPVFDHSALIRV